MIVRAVLRPSGDSYVLDEAKSSVKLIDTDLKPLTNLQKWYELDETLWRHWMATRGSEEQTVVIPAEPKDSPHHSYHNLTKATGARAGAAAAGAAAGGAVAAGLYTSSPNPGSDSSSEYSVASDDAADTEVPPTTPPTADVTAVAAATVASAEPQPQSSPALEPEIRAALERFDPDNEVSERDAGPSDVPVPLDESIVPQTETVIVSSAQVAPEVSAPAAETTTDIPSVTAGTAETTQAQATPEPASDPSSEPSSVKENTRELNKLVAEVEAEPAQREAVTAAVESTTPASSTASAPAAVAQTSEPSSAAAAEETAPEPTQAIESAEVAKESAVETAPVDESTAEPVQVEEPSSTADKRADLGVLGTAGAAVGAAALAAGAATAAAATALVAAASKSPERPVSDSTEDAPAASGPLTTPASATPTSTTPATSTLLTPAPSSAKTQESPSRTLARKPSDLESPGRTLNHKASDLESDSGSKFRKGRISSLFNRRASGTAKDLPKVSPQKAVSPEKSKDKHDRQPSEGFTSRFRKPKKSGGAAAATAATAAGVAAAATAAVAASKDDKPVEKDAEPTAEVVVIDAEPPASSEDKAEPTPEAVAEAQPTEDEPSELATAPAPTKDGETPSAAVASDDQPTGTEGEDEQDTLDDLNSRELSASPHTPAMPIRDAFSSVEATPATPLRLGRQTSLTIPPSASTNQVTQFPRLSAFGDDLRISPDLLHSPVTNSGSPILNEHATMPTRTLDSPSESPLRKADTAFPRLSAFIDQDAPGIDALRHLGENEAPSPIKEESRSLQPSPAVATFADSAKGQIKTPPLDAFGITAMEPAGVPPEPEAESTTSTSATTITAIDDSDTSTRQKRSTAPSPSPHMSSTTIPEPFAGELDHVAEESAVEPSSLNGSDSNGHADEPASDESQLLAEPAIDLNSPVKPAPADVGPVDQPGPIAAPANVEQYSQAALPPLPIPASASMALSEADLESVSHGSDAWATAPVSPVDTQPATPITSSLSLSTPDDADRTPSHTHTLSGAAHSLSHLALPVVEEQPSTPVAKSFDAPTPTPATPVIPVDPVTPTPKTAPTVPTHSRTSTLDDAQFEDAHDDLEATTTGTLRGVSKDVAAQLKSTAAE